MRIRMKKTRTAITVFLFCLLIFFSASSEDLSVKRVGQIVCFDNNAFDIHAPEAGEIIITIRNDTSVFRRIHEQVDAGKTRIVWDGLGFNHERLYPMTYHIDAELIGISGNTYDTHFDSPVVGCSQALLFALPSADTAYISNPEEWFFECKAVTGGTLVIQFLEPHADTPSFTFERSIPSGRISRLTLKSIFGKTTPKTGEYTVRVFEKTAPYYTAEFSLMIGETKPNMPEVGPTGPIMPQAGATDDEIWQLMISPAVVVDIGNHAHQIVYTSPDESSPSLGTLHGQTQTLEVLSTENGWAKIRAWNHEEAELVEGYVPISKLKVKYPQKEYGLLIDKNQQTMTVFFRGQRIGTVLVCTGRMQKNALYQETSAGSFLTGDHRVDYSMYGNKYDFVIQYDGGNLIHQIPYAFGNEKKDFTNGRALLGTKGSHACIRVQAEPDEESGINAYWIWTHIPHDTRVIILDDPAERKAYRAILSGEAAHGNSARLLMSDLDEHQHDSSTVFMTFGGNTVLGMQETAFNRDGSFKAYITERGYTYPLSGVSDIFQNDDITGINLVCVLKENRAEERAGKNAHYRGLPEYANVLTEGSVDLVNLANDHTMDYGTAGYRETAESVSSRHILWCGNGKTSVISVKDHRIGFAAFTESEYLKDPYLIDRDIQALWNAGCEFIVCQCHWGNENESFHNIMQEAMARTCVRNGAGLIIGYHPGKVQGIDYVSGVPVIYGLGNLCIGSSAALKDLDGILVQAAVSFSTGTPDLELKLIPITASSSDDINDYHPVPADGENAERIISAVQSDTGFDAK